MSIPSVSVVMPVYNAGVFLAPAVESILAQDFHEFEFVIIDDGSTDKSPKLLQAFARLDSRIRVISRPNTGIVKALNDGLQAARAPFVARMDADDLSMSGRLRRQFDYLKAHEQCVAVGSRILLIDTEGWPICEMCQERTHEEIDSANLRGGGSAMNHPSVMFRTVAVRAIGGYRAELIYAEDLDLWLRLAEVGRLYNLPDVLLRYRMHAKSISHARSLEQHRKWRMAAEDAMRRRGDSSAQPTLADDGLVNEKATTEADNHIRWAWWALMSGNLRTARKHALAGLRCAPLSIESWRLACCVARGY